MATKVLERTLAALQKELDKAERKAGDAKAVYNALASHANKIRSQMRQLERTISYLNPGSVDPETGEPAE